MKNIDAKNSFIISYSRCDPAAQWIYAPIWYRLLSSGRVVNVMMAASQQTHKWKEAAALSRARLLFSPTLNTESVNGKCK